MHDCTRTDLIHSLSTSNLTISLETNAGVTAAAASLSLFTFSLRLVGGQTVCAAPSVIDVKKETKISRTAHRARMRLCEKDRVPPRKAA